jgi:pyrophosphate--fructose-6-phosphate 1-phosphotransferase
MAHVAVDSGLAHVPGLIGNDEARGDVLRAIELPRVKGGKRFDTEAAWFTEMLAEIGQPAGAPVTAGAEH